MGHIERHSWLGLSFTTPDLGHSRKRARDWNLCPSDAHSINVHKIEVPDSYPFLLLFRKGYASIKESPVVCWFSVCEPALSSKLAPVKLKWP